MAAISKWDEAYDADYVDKMMGKVLVKACAAVTINKPNDPIEYLSLWLHKYCDNAITIKDYENEKMLQMQKEANEKEAQMKKFMIEQELKQQQNSTLNHMSSITNDPYRLWETCLRSITTYTGCQAAYIAVVVRKIFEPKPIKKKKTENQENEEEDEEEEEEEDEDEDGGSDATSIDEEPPEIDEEKNDDKGNKDGNESKEEVDEEDDDVEGDGEEKIENEPPPLKPFRAPKPFNYKSRRLLYVAATSPAHIHMLNRQMVIKQGPVTFSLLLDGLQSLHIPNVLYKEGIHYFGGCPRVGAYFVAPISIEYIAKKYLSEEFKNKPLEMFDTVKQKKVIALLCCDTLKSDRTGTGRPFKPIELDFFQACASTMSKILDQNNKEILKHHNTPSVIKKFKDQLKEIKLARVEQMKKEKVDALKRKKVKEKANKLKQFNELHKAWEEHQAVKARIKEKLKRQRERMKKMLKKDGEELQKEELDSKQKEELEDSDEDDDLEPILEDELEEEESPPIEDEDEEKPNSSLEENKEINDENEFVEEELEPNPMVEIKEEEENEDDILLEDEEEEEKEEPNVEDDPNVDGEEGIEKPNESEAMIKLKDKKKTHEKKEKEIKQIVKGMAKSVKEFERRRKKALGALQKLTPKIEKYERALFMANGVVEYLRKHMHNAHNLIVENKISQLEQMQRWPYPNRHIQRILKALLHLLGHKKLVIDDWATARKLFNSNLLDKVLKDYDPLKAIDQDRWDNVDSYLIGLNEKKLSELACIGYLLQQWILACKKTTAAGINYHKIKSKFDELSKEYATLEMEKMVCDLETQMLNKKLKKIVDEEDMRVEKEINEIETMERHLAKLAAEEKLKKEKEDQMYAEYAANQSANEGNEVEAEED